MPGLYVVLGIVVLGLASGAGYFQYKAPRLKRDLHASLEAAPKSLEGRLEAWLRYGAPNIHHRLAIFGRFSEEYPWLITHAVGGSEGEALAFGIDCTTLPLDLCDVEGDTLVVHVPAPRRLGRVPLGPQERIYIPVYASESEVPDPRERLRALALHLLDKLPEALEKDIAGAHLEVRVEDGAER